MNDRLDKALELLGRVVTLMAKRPDELDFAVEQTAGTCEVTITANPADTKRLVGRQRETLRQLEALFRMLAHGCGVKVGLCYLIPNSNPEPPFLPFVARHDWPRFMVENLLKDVTEAVFELPAQMRTEVKNPYSVKMYATIQGDLSGSQLLGLYDKTVNGLFTVIGTNVGMKVYAHAEDWYKAASSVAPR